MHSYSSSGRTEDERIQEFNALIARWKLPGLVLARPCNVIPDTTNRAQTGLSAHHTHYIATKMDAEGFQKRQPNGQGHDIPILVSESTTTQLGSESLQKWRKTIDENEHFAPLSEDFSHTNFFTSLGNGHFFQALNLFRSEHPKMFVRDQVSKYDPRGDQLLSEAINEGVLAVVLRSDIPKRDRSFLSEILNGAFHYKWEVSAATGVRIIPGSSRDASTSAFEAMSKTLDAFELGVLVEQHTKILEAEKQRKLARSKL